MALHPWALYCRDLSTLVPKFTGKCITGVLGHAPFLLHLFIRHNLNFFPMHAARADGIARAGCVYDPEFRLSGNVSSLPVLSAGGLDRFPSCSIWSAHLRARQAGAGQPLERASAGVAAALATSGPRTSRRTLPPVISGPYGYGSGAFPW